MFAACIIVTLIGLLICFRGVCISKAFRALFGALQGAIWSVIISLVLQMLDIVMGSGLYLLILAIMAICAYIAAFQEKLYYTIQGIINALTVGGVLADISFILIRGAQTFGYMDGGGSGSLASVVAIVILIIFFALGVKAYNFFRRLGTIVFVFLALALALFIYMPIVPALLLAAVVSLLFAYIASAYNRYIEVIKIALIGAVLAVSGVWMLIDGSFAVFEIVEILTENAQRAMDGYSATGASMASSLVIISGATLVLTVWGVYSQNQYLLAHTDSNGKFIYDGGWLKKLFSGIGVAFSSIINALSNTISSIANFFSERKHRILKGIKTILIIVIAIACVYGAVLGGKALIAYINVQKETKTVDNAAVRYSKQINEAYGSDIISLDEVSFVGEAGDGFDSSFTAEIKGELQGELLCAGINDPEGKDWYLDYGYVILGIDYNRIDETSKLFAAVVSTMLNVNYDECESEIWETLMYSDFSPQGEWGITPWIEVNLGTGSNASVIIGQFDNEWKMDFSTAF